MDCQTVRDNIHVEPTSALVGAHLTDCSRCAAYDERFARLDHVLRGELVLSAPAALSTQLETVASPSPPLLNRLEAVIRDELVVETPPALSARLLGIVSVVEGERPRVTSPMDSVVRDQLVLQAPTDLTARLQALVPLVPAAAASPSTASHGAPASVAPARPRRWVVATVYFVTASLLFLSLFYASSVYSLVITQLGLEQWLSEIAALPATLLNQLYVYVPQARTVVGWFVQLQQPLQWLLVALVLWAVIDMTQRQGQRHRDNSRQQYA